MTTFDKIKQILDDQDAEIKRLKVALEATAKNPVNIYYDEPVIIEGFDDVAVPFNAQYAFATDAYWYGIDKEDVERVLENHRNIKDMKYEETICDCEDYAQALHGVFNQHGLSRFAFGFATSGGHAFNFFVDRQKKVWIVEPQDFNIFEYTQNISSNYKVERWVI